MSNTNSIQNQNSDSNDKTLQGGTLVQFPNSAPSSNNSDQTQNIQPPSAQPVPTQSKNLPEEPSGAPAKEQEPLPSQSVNEFIAPSEKSVEIEPEVAEVGVKEGVNEPKLSLEDKIAGIENAMESIPVNTAMTQKTQYPITKEEAEKEMKGPIIFKNTSKAMLWLAMLILRQLKIREKEMK